MLNLRFKWVVASSLFYVMWAAPKGTYMIKHPEKYTVRQRYNFGLHIVNHMKKRSRTTTDVYGLENLPKENGYILYSNHQGKYDALGILLALQEPCGVLWEKKSAERLVARQVCGLVGGVKIDLNDMREKAKAIKEVVDKVKAGMNFLIFPEGGYKDNRNTLQEFFSGCFTCSLATKGPIVPVAVYDSYKSMNSNTFEKVKTQVHFLPPLFYEEYRKMKKPELCELVKSRIQAKLNEIEGGNNSRTI